MLESQAGSIAAAVGHAYAHGLAAVQPTKAAEDGYAGEVERMSAGTVWTACGCRSGYLNESGRNVNIWPGTTFDFRRRTRRFDSDAHLMHRPVGTAASADRKIRDGAIYEAAAEMS